MKHPKLKTVINNLEKLRKKYIDMYGVEPTVWIMSEDNGSTVVELCSGTKRKGMCTTSLGNNMEGKIEMGMM